MNEGTRFRRIARIGRGLPAILGIAGITVLGILGSGGILKLAHGETQLHGEIETQGRIQHVVLCWLREPGNEAVRRKLIETTEELADLPGVVSVTAGVPLASERPVVDDSFDVGIVFTFRDAEALAAYQVHPRHREAVETVLQPLVEKLLVYDIQPLPRLAPTE